MLKHLAATAALMCLASCGHIIESTQCTNAVCAGQPSRADALQTYALPQTIVDLTFTKADSGASSLAITSRNVADDDAHFWYRFDYAPNEGSVDKVTLTINNGLLNTADAQSTAELPDIASAVHPLLSALGVGVTAAGGQISSEPVDPNQARRRFLDANDPEQRRRVLAQGPDDLETYSPFSNAQGCTIDSLMDSVTPLANVDGDGALLANACAMQVGSRIRTVRLACASADRHMLDADRMRSLFGTIDVKSECSGDNKRQGTFSFEFVDARVWLLGGADQGARLTDTSHDSGTGAGPGANVDTNSSVSAEINSSSGAGASANAASPAIRYNSAGNLYRFWYNANRSIAPYSIEGCTQTHTTDRTCFPNGASGGLFYRTTAPFQVRAVLCEQGREYPPRHDDGVVGSHVAFADRCHAISPDRMNVLGATQQVRAVVRRWAYALPMPRTIGGDHRKYTMTDGVLTSVEIDRTGSLIGIVRLPLTLLGIGSGS
jgi:hypothetical protein